MAWMSDTSPEAERVLIELYRPTLDNAGLDRRAGSLGVRDLLDRARRESAEAAS